MKAQTLEQAVDYFNHREPLYGQYLDFWYVERPDTPRPMMEKYLRAKRDPVKLLLIGPRGGGKSTELNKLIDALQDRYYTFNLSVSDLVGGVDVNYVDVMRLIASRVIRAAIADEMLPLPLNQAFQDRLEPLYNWWRTRVSGLEFSRPGGDVEVKLKFQTLLGEVESTARSSITTRKALNDQLELHMSELIRQLNEAIDEVRRRSNKAALIVVEQTDKIDRAAATAIFRDHATTLALPTASMIYTFPNAMRFSDDFNTIFLAFDNCHIFANLPVYRRADGGPHDVGRRKLAQLVYRRLEENLIDADALTRLIELSGGQLTSLIFLVGNAALGASMRGQPRERITLPDTDYAVNQLRRILIGALSEADYAALADFHRRRPILTNEPDVQRLLYNGALLEYPGDDSAQNYPWCDAHPILWDRLTGE